MNVVVTYVYFYNIGTILVIYIENQCIMYKKLLPFICLALFQVTNAVAQNSSCFYSPYNKQFVGFDCMTSGQNLITNANFENGSVGWSLVPNATRVSISNSGYNSAKSLQITSTNNAGGDAMISQTIPNLTPGSQSSISGYLYSPLAVNNNVVSVNLQVRFNYPNGAYSILSQVYFPTSTWTKYTFNFTVPNNPNILVTLAQVSMYRGQNNYIKVDDLEIGNNGSAFPFVNTPVPVAPVAPLYEDFKGVQGDKIACSKWMVVKKSWGNNYVLNNNGVVPENLELLCDGGLRMHAHGDLYNGPVLGATTDLGNGKIRTGACIATKDYYASGLYEVEAKLTPGAVNAFWTFHYIEDAAYQNGGIKNSEIDWEFPSNNYFGSKNVLNDAMCNTWGGLCDGVGLTTSGVAYQQALGNIDLSQAFHKYTIEWHTGGGAIAPSIKWYIDNVLVKVETNPTYIPFRASRFWIGVWFGNTNWITGGDMSVLQYADRFMEVKSVSITPFYEANDIYENETNPATGYVTPTLYPVYPCSNVGAKAAASNNEFSTTDYSGGMFEAATPSNSVQLMLNQSSNSIHMSIANAKEDYITKVRIYSSNGQLMETIEYRNQETEATIMLDHNYPNGMYFVQATTQNGTTFKSKFAVTHQ